jgi:hypothetical protein
MGIYTIDTAINESLKKKEAHLSEVGGALDAKARNQTRTEIYSWE